MKTIFLLLFTIIVSSYSVAQPDSCLFTVPSMLVSNCDCNDDFKFTITSNCGISSSDLRIFDRWGEVIYESQGKDLVWDAYKVPQGTYFYLFTGLYVGGVGFEKQGYVTVIR